MQTLQNHELFIWNVSGFFRLSSILTEWKKKTRKMICEVNVSCHWKFALRKVTFESLKGFEVSNIKKGSTRIENLAVESRRIPSQLVFLIFFFYFNIDFWFTVTSRWNVRSNTEKAFSTTEILFVEVPIITWVMKRNGKYFKVLLWKKKFLILCKLRPNDLISNSCDLKYQMLWLELCFSLNSYGIFVMENFLSLTFINKKAHAKKTFILVFSS